MAWSWKILRAAVEQEILFPSKESLESYIDLLKQRDEPFEINNVQENGDGTLTVVMRKRYNRNNPFLWKE